MTATLNPNDRRDLYQRFQHVIEGTYDQLLEKQELNYKQNMLKSFLVESNIDPESLKDISSRVSVRSIDYELFEVIIERDVSNEENQTIVNRSSLAFYLDSQDSRFWTFYTLERSEEAKSIIDRLISQEGSGLDYLWFPAQFQERLTKMGEFEGAGINYDPDEVFSEEYIDDFLPFGELSLQSSGKGTKWLIDVLDRAELKQFMSLSAIRIRRETEDSFIIERVDNKGRITTRGGDNIQAHLDFIGLLRDMYGDLVRTIEENSRIGYPSRTIGVDDSERQSQAQTVQGSPIIINLENEIDDLKRFATHMTSATKPLRLWGAGTWLSPDYYKVRGTDLHNNDSFTLEIKQNWLRLYLPDDACGNTALRIFSNIQRYYDAEAKFGEKSAPEHASVELSA